jgi:uncharacterized protein
VTSSVYVDTSALARVILEEPGNDAVLRDLGRFDQRVASRLLAVELRRVGRRSGAAEEVDRLLSRVSLIPLDDDVLAAAGTIEPAAVGTLDAIHLATAMRLREAGRLDALMTYDKQLAHAAREHGIEVLSPS